MRILTLFLILMMTSGCNETILHQLEEQAANKVVLTLANSGVEARKVADGDSWAIEVPKNISGKALRALKDKRTFSQIERKPPIFKSSLVSGREERKAMLEGMKITRLEHSIKSLPSVLEAWVHLNKVEAGTRVFGSSKRESSASVLIISERPERVDEIEIKRLVSGAVGTKLPVIEVIIEESSSTSIKEKSHESSRGHEYISFPSVNLLKGKAAILGGIVLAMGTMMMVFKQGTESKSEKKENPGLVPGDLFIRGDNENEK